MPTASRNLNNQADLERLKHRIDRVRERQPLAIRPTLIPAREKQAHDMELAKQKHEHDMKVSAAKVKLSNSDSSVDSPEMSTGVRFGGDVG